MGWRSRVPCGALLLGGVLLLVAGVLGMYGRAAVLDERAFADRATAALAQDEVRDEIAARISDREIEAEPALAQLKPTIDAAVASVVGDFRFPQTFRTATVGLHRSLFDGGSADLRLPGARAELERALPPRSRAAELLPAGDPELFHLGGGRLESGLVDAAPTARRLARFSPIALLAGLALLFAAAWRAPTRRRGARRAALGVAVAGGLLIAATTIGRAIVLSTFDTSHGDAVVGTIWDSFLGDLRLWGLLLGASGLIVAAAFEPGARGAWRPVTNQLLTPIGTAGRLTRVVGLLLLAGLLLWFPEVPMDLALVTAAGVLVFTAAAEVTRLSSTR